MLLWLLYELRWRELLELLVQEGRSLLNLVWEIHYLRWLVIYRGSLVLYEWGRLKL